MTAPVLARSALRRRQARRRLFGAFALGRTIRDGKTPSDRRYIESPAR